MREKQDWILAGSMPLGHAVLAQTHRGLIHCGFFQVRFRVYKSAASKRLLPSFFFGAGNRLDSRGLTPLGQRRFLPPHRLIAIRPASSSPFPEFTKKKPSALPSFFFWCGKQGLILAGSCRSGQPFSSPTETWIHCGFFQVRFP